jgi:L-aminopeptidase/D-esterase-like protein
MAKLDRRRFAQLASAVPFMTMKNTPAAIESAGGLTDIPGIRVGHFTDNRRPTGCTVVLTEKGAVAGVDVRGSAPGTRETDLLKPEKTVQEVHAILLSGGSAFGLDAASGVVRYLEEKRIGFPTPVGPVPIVPAAILYDLLLGDPSIRPDQEAGYQACTQANDGRIPEGNVGAGAGALCGLFFGKERSTKSGLGSAGVQVDDLRVAALMAVNCAGDVVDPRTGGVLAGVRTEGKSKSFLNLSRWLRRHRYPASDHSGENTTLGVIATNASFTQAQMTKIAQMGHDGIARAIRPAHLPMEGDSVFALSYGEVDVDLGQVGALAAQVVAQAIVRAVKAAISVEGIPAYRDLIAK